MDINRLIKQATDNYSAQNYKAALTQCKLIIKSLPNNPLGYKLSATNYVQLEQYANAEKSIKKAIKLGGNELASQQLLATTLIEQGNIPQAIEQLEALFNQTGELALLLDLGLAYTRLGDRDVALAIYNKMLEISPTHQQAQFNASTILLHMQQFETGWALFENRFSLASYKGVNQPSKLTTVVDLTDKNVLVTPEQGIADQLLFATCINDLVAIAASVTLVCEPRLKTLFARVFANVTVVDSTELEGNSALLKAFDTCIPIGSLPKMFRQKEGDFPASKNNQNLPFEALRNTLALSSDKLNVGISWFGGKANNKQQNRWSSQLKDWTELLNTPGVQWYNLQFGESKPELKKQTAIHTLEGHTAHDDFQHYAELICGLDLVISVDNTAAIFAALLGTKTWVITPPDPFWAWPYDEHSSPWFEDVSCIKKPLDCPWKECLGSLQPGLIEVRNKKQNNA